MKLLQTFTVCLLLLISATASAQWLATTTSVPNEFDRIYFRNSQLGYAASFKGYIYKTVNGGQNWSQVLRPDQLTGFDKFVINDIYFITDNIGFFVGYDFWEANYLILQTSDGGQNWDYTSYERSLNVIGECNAIEFTSALTGYIVGDDGQMFKTTNSGLNWQPGVLPSAASTDLIDLEFINDLVGYVLGKSGKLYKTIDGGSSWTSSYLPYSMDQIFFFSEQIGLAIGDNGLYKTTNAGLGWTLVSKPNSSAAFPKAFFLNENVGYFQTGELLKTVDGGLHWFKQEINVGAATGASFYDLFLLDEQTGWLSGGKNGTNGNRWSLLANTLNGGGLGLDMALSSTQLTCPGDSVTASATWLGNPLSFNWYLDNVLTYTGTGPKTFYNLPAGTHKIKLQVMNGSNTVEVEKNVSVPNILSFPNQTFTISSQPCQGLPAKVSTSWNNQNNARLLIYNGSTFIDTVLIQTENNGSRFFMLPPVMVSTTFRFEATYPCASGIAVGQVTVNPKLLPYTNYTLSTPQTVFCSEKTNIPITISGSEPVSNYRFYQDGVQIDQKYGNLSPITINSDKLEKDSTFFWVVATNNSNCTTNLPDTLVVYIDKTDARFAVNGLNLPIGSPVEVTFLGLNASAYNWDFGQGASPATSTDKQPGTISYNGGLNTRIQLITSGFLGCQDTFVKNIAMYSPADIGEYWAQDMNQGMPQQYYLPANHVAVDQEGNVFTNGFATKQATIPSRAGTGLTAEKGGGLIKYDRYGVLQWYIHHEGIDLYAKDILTDKDNNMIVLYQVNNFQLLYDFVNVGSTDEKLRRLALGKGTVAAKWDPDGKLLWLSEIKTCTQSGISAKDLELDDDGNIYVLASLLYTNQCSNNQVTFLNADSSSFTQTTASHFVSKLSPDGNFQWVRNLVNSSGVNVSTALSLTLDSQKNMIIGGNNGSTIGFALLAKYDPEGNLLWEKTPASVSPAPRYQVFRVITDDSGNIYVNGDFQGALDFGNVAVAATPGNNVYDQFVMKVNPNGQVQWLKAMVSSFNITATGMAIYDDDLYVGATFSYQYQMGTQLQLTMSSLDNTAVVWLQLSGQNGALKKYKVLNEVPPVSTTKYSNYGNSIAIDDAGNLHLSGVNGYRATFADTLLTTPKNAFLAKVRGLDNAVPTFEPLQENQLHATISPNPGRGKGMLQLDLEAGQRISCRLTNLQGQSTMLWENLEITASHADLWLDPVPAGVYFLHISNEKGATAVVKWVVVD